MDFDVVLEEIGEFGRYQQTNYLLLCLPVLFGAANSLSYVFTAGVPRYRCYVPGCDHPKDPTLDEPWVSHAVPGKTDASGEFTPELCTKYQRNETLPMSYLFTKDLDCPADSFSSTTEQCSRWVYEKDDYTIVQEWEITCPENQWMLALVGTMHFAGIVFGSAAFGFMADRFGRKRIFIFCTLFMAITGIGQALSPTYITFLVFAFLNAVGTSGVYPLAFILGVEMVGPKKREMSGIVLNYFYAIGEALVGLFAWLSKDWVVLQFIVSAPPLLFVIYYWFIPESVRWLLARHNTTKAGKIIKTAARINGVVLSDALLHTIEDVPQELDDECKKRKSKEMQIQRQHEMLAAFKQAFTSMIFIGRFLILAFVWATNAFVYYGLSLNSTTLSGNKYLNFALVCLIEIPGYSLAWFAMKHIGRRWPLSGSLLLCAGTCIAGAFVTQGSTSVIVTLFLIGKLGITASFAIIYVHTAEMLPTIIRSGSVGLMSTVARIGATIAPFVPLLGTYYQPLPLTVFGITSFISGLLVLFLPETFGKKLPDTVEEAEQIGKKKPVIIAPVEGN